jgi:hypothetical protein
LGRGFSVIGQQQSLASLLQACDEVRLQYFIEQGI